MLINVYPYGMLMPNRKNNTGLYRYGFQGQENDNEIKGEGNSVNYKYRMHDPRLGRFFAVDPLTFEYPFYSPYVYSGNRLMDRIELEGLEPDLPPFLHDIFSWLSRKTGPALDNAGQAIGKGIAEMHPGVVAYNVYQGALGNEKTYFGEDISKGDTAFEIFTSLPITRPLKFFKFADEAGDVALGISKAIKEGGKKLDKLTGGIDSFKDIRGLANHSKDVQRRKTSKPKIKDFVEAGDSSTANKVFEALKENGFKVKETPNGNKLLTKGDESIVFRKSQTGGGNVFDTFTKKVDGKEVDVFFGIDNKK